MGPTLKNKVSCIMRDMCQSLDLTTHSLSTTSLYCYVSVRSKLDGYCFRKFNIIRITIFSVGHFKKVLPFMVLSIHTFAFGPFF